MVESCEDLQRFVEVTLYIFEHEGKVILNNLECKRSLERWEYENLLERLVHILGLEHMYG
jgi:hypothetical protein